MKKLLEQLLGGDRVGLIDVGGGGGPEPRWRVLEHGLRHYVFEPDERSFETLVKLASESYKVYPYAVGAAPGEVAFNLCRQPQTSSVYQPNRSLVDEFPDRERWDIVDVERILLRTLDDVLSGEDEEVDFIKIDTQGSELDVLRGAKRILGSVFGAEIEVEFVELYRGQPLFGDVCRHLDERGFQFLDFTNLCRWQRGGPAHSQFGQCVFGDALFLKHPSRLADELAALDPGLVARKARRYIAVLALYDRPDLIGIAGAALAHFLNDDLALLSTIVRRLQRRRRWIDETLKMAWRIVVRGGYRPFPLQIR